MLVNPDDYITTNKFFKWKEALYLNSLKCYHSPSAQEIDNIRETCLKLDEFRKLLGKPFNITCWIRPSSVNDESGKNTGFDYNKHVGGAKVSSHITGHAIDFQVSGLTVDQAMAIISPKLSTFKMAAENNGSKVR